jgi:hypothetical protein
MFVPVDSRPQSKKTKTLGAKYNDEPILLKTIFYFLKCAEF